MSELLFVEDEDDQLTPSNFDDQPSLDTPNNTTNGDQTNGKNDVKSTNHTITDNYHSEVLTSTTTPLSDIIASTPKLGSTVGNDTVENSTIGSGAADRPVESSTVDSRSVESRPVESSTVDSRPVESTKIDTKVESTPVENSPVESRPVENSPVESRPVESTKVESTPVESTTVGSKPVESRPVESSTLESNTVGSRPVESRPVESSTVDSRPVESRPVESSTVGSRPVESTKVESTKVESTPVENSLVESTKVESTPVESSTLESNTVGSRPVESGTVESSTLDSNTVESRSIESGSVENPSESRPIESKPVESSVVESTPADNNPVKSNVENTSADSSPVASTLVDGSVESSAVNSSTIGSGTVDNNTVGSSTVSSGTVDNSTVGSTIGCGKVGSLLKKLTEKSNCNSEQDNLNAAIERVRRYALSELDLHRLYFVRDLVDHGKTMSYKDALIHLFPLFNGLARDNVPAIRQGVAEQIPELANFYKEKVDSNEFIVDMCLPLISDLLKDSTPQVREAAVTSLLELAPVVSSDVLRKNLLPIVKNLANDTVDEDNRVQAAQILDELAPVMGTKLTEEFTLPFVKKLAQDPTFRVRKAVASNLHFICETIGVDNTTDIILPIYLNFAEDEIWGVRKACADSLVAISKNITREERLGKLVDLFNVLAEDKSRWVRSAAFEALGPFIATFSKEDLPSTLLNHYRNLAKPENNDNESTDNDRSTYCAFNLPAVLQTIGKEQWNDLKDTYGILVKDVNWQVRRTLSFSLHVVAEILGQKLTEETLLPTFELFLQDLDEVKIGVTKNLAKFLKVLSPETRLNYCYVLDQARKSKNWRFRRLIAKQLGDLAEVFGPEIVQKEIIPFATSLITDQIACVRKALPYQITKIINSLNNHIEERDKFLNDLKLLASNPMTSNRLAFTKLAEASVGGLDKDVFQSIFLTPLLELAKDKVPNVRMFTAVALKKILLHEAYKDSDLITNAVKELMIDKDRDVIIYAGGTPPIRTRKKLNKVVDGVVVS